MTVILVLAAAVWMPAADGRDYLVFDVVGDSISAGVNPECGTYGWVHMLFGQTNCGQALNSQTLTNLWPGITAYNSAVSGSTARQWAWAAPSYLQTVSNHHPDLVVVFIGGNDGLGYACDGFYSPQEQGEFRTNLTLILQKLHSFCPAPEIIVANYYDLFDGFSSSLPPLYAAYTNLSAAVREGNRMIEEIAFSNGCFHVDVHSEFMHHCYGAELGDTNHLSPAYVRTPLSAFDIHPVTAGHNTIRELIFERLTELHRIPEFTAASAGISTISLQWRSGIGQSYVVERSTNLTGAFIGVATNIATPPANVFNEDIGEINRAFYRIRVE
ncbi:MAG: SGNH/GDSL hydrolase family protein [Kiritimatiellia bacterium]